MGADLPLSFPMHAKELIRIARECPGQEGVVLLPFRHYGPTLPLWIVAGPHALGSPATHRTVTDGSTRALLYADVCTGHTLA
jgi:hypothetical protein